jgi:agmatine/peptidylarginine deiminase
LADKLKILYSDFFNRFTHLLNEMDIKWDLIPHTKDIWVRDFMPIQTVNGGFLQYNYKPDYLQDNRFIRLQSDTSLICESMQITRKKTGLILDGGNITLCGNRIVMTDKIFKENHKEKSDVAFIKLLEDFFGHEIVIIPWHCINPDDEYADVFGHSDGFIHWCGGDQVLMYNHRDVDSEEAKRIREIMESYGYQVTEMLYDVEVPETDWNWAYINYLQVGKKIIIPSFGIPEDKQALTYVKRANPDCEVRQIRMRDIAANGGALHCITWNIRQ